MPFPQGQILGLFLIIAKKEITFIPIILGLIFTFLQGVVNE
jgi:hypothetical protein